MTFLTAVMFATEDAGWGWWPVIATFITTLLASLVANLILLWKEWRRSNEDGQSLAKQKRRDTVEEYEVLLRKMERMGDRHETEILTLQRVVAILSQRCADCDSDMERIFSHLRNFHGVASRLADGLEKLGGDPEPVPKIPAMPQRRYPDADFLARTTAQFAAAGKAADQSDAGLRAPGNSVQRGPDGENPTGG